jgi:hypothetical protein
MLGFVDANSNEELLQMTRGQVHSPFDGQINTEIVGVNRVLFRICTNLEDALREDGLIGFNLLVYPAGPGPMAASFSLFHKPYKI